MEKPACSQLRTKLQEIIDLKAEFDLELPKIKDTRNTAPALKLEEEIRGKIKLIKEDLMLAHCEWREITIGIKSKEELIRELEEREGSNNPKEAIYISNDAKNMLQKPEFTVISKPEKINLIKVKVQDLGFENKPTANELYSRAEELGLELCPPEIGPHLRLHYQEVFKREQPKEEYLYIGMKQITDSSGYPDVFSVNHLGYGRRSLNNFWADPWGKLDLKLEFIFICK